MTWIFIHDTMAAYFWSPSSIEYDFDPANNSLTDTAFHSALWENHNIIGLANIYMDVLIPDDETLWIWEAPISDHWVGLPSTEGVVHGIRLTTQDYSDLYNIYMGF